MPLFAISLLEPVTAPNATNIYKHNEENSAFSHNYTGNPKQFQSNPNKSQNHTQDQIVYMERSVQENIGHHLNVYV